MGSIIFLVGALGAGAYAIFAKRRALAAGPARMAP
jgi:NADH:ubiquinone oxidoreductase subunit H